MKIGMGEYQILWIYPGGILITSTAARIHDEAPDCLRTLDIDLVGGGSLASVIFTKSLVCVHLTYSRYKPLGG
jgi:hypothetical protein